MRFGRRDDSNKRSGANRDPGPAMTVGGQSPVVSVVSRFQQRPAARTPVPFEQNGDVCGSSEIAPPSLRPRAPWQDDQPTVVLGIHHRKREQRAGPGAAHAKPDQRPAEHPIRRRTEHREEHRAVDRLTGQRRQKPTRDQAEHRAGERSRERPSATTADTDQRAPGSVAPPKMTGMATDQASTFALTQRKGCGTNPRSTQACAAPRTAPITRPSPAAPAITRSSGGSVPPPFARTDGTDAPAQPRPATTRVARSQCTRRGRRSQPESPRDWARPRQSPRRDHRRPRQTSRRWRPTLRVRRR